MAVSNDQPIVSVQLGPLSAGCARAIAHTSTITGAGFILSIPPLIYFFIKHSVRRVPGAYTQYAFFEWGLVFWDVAFDAGCLYELNHLQVRIVDTTRGDEPHKGWVQA